MSTEDVTPEEVLPAASALDSEGAALLAAIVASSDDAIVSKTLEGEVRSWNAAATRIFGYQPDEIIGRSITTIIPPELLDEEREILRKIRHGERIEHFDTIRVTKDGRRIPISLTVSPVRDAHGKIVGASKVARDISERRKTEGLLRDADRRKDEFLALLAHELRNPLAPIRYALELMKGTAASEALRSKGQQIIERQVAQLARLVDDLMDVARVTRGRLDLRKQQVKLQAIAVSAIETARPLIEAKHHRLTVSMPDSPVAIEADAVRLAQAFANLLVNAAKFTPAGGHIEFRVHVEPADTVRVTVRDDGVGISADMQPRLFTMFAQDRRSLSEGGLGVGLCLVRELVALHGGSVEASSPGEGRGSVFTVMLPVTVQTAAVGRSIVEWDAVSGLRVLVVDDNQDVTDSCRALLALAGCEVEGAYTARRALELAAKLHPRVVLLDIGLPDLSGYEVARKIRGSDWGAHSVLVAITGWGQAHDRQLAREAGFDWHVTKPIAADDLRSFLRSVAQSGTHQRTVFGERLRALQPT